MAASMRKARARASLAALGIVALLLSLAACAPQAVILEERDGIIATLRDERNATRQPPGPEFANLTDSQLEYSLRRVVIRPSKAVIFIYSNPVPLFSEPQMAVIRDVLLRELPKLPPDKRIGFEFRDIHKQNDVDMEIYVEGNRLVYEFRALLRRRKENLNRGEGALNAAIVYPQRTQIVEDNSYPAIKDDITSMAKPDLRLLDEEERKKEDDKVF